MAARASVQRGRVSKAAGLRRTEVAMPIPCSPLAAEAEMRQREPRPQLGERRPQVGLEG